MALTEPIVYFEDAGAWQDNTQVVVETVAAYAKAHGVKHIVAASCTGYVGAQFAPVRQAHPDLTVAAVKMAPAIDRMYDVKVNADYVRTMEQAGVAFFGGTHVLTGGADRALRAKFEGGFPPTAIIAETLYLFSQGMKVAVEIIAMACDAGALPEGVEVIACGGTGQGADTVIVATSAASANLFEMKIHRILAMPL
jgi:uncharacterized protein